MAMFFTADWHLGEDRFALMGRPFTTEMEQLDRLVHEHNRLVAPHDEVIVVGDVTYSKRPEFLQYVSRFNGRKTLIRGNHDIPHAEVDLAKHFDCIFPDGDGMYLDVKGVKCFVTHYPSRGVVDAFNIVGHIHAVWKVQKNMLNVGVDVHNFRPVEDKAIPFYLKAITEFYDQDVWVDTHPANAAHKGRGKPGNYFIPSAQKPA